jgi:hypothetical protein
MIPPKQRTAVANTFNTTYSYLSSGLLLSGKTIWVLSTSALLFGVPWALAFSEEAQMMEMERERMMQADVNEVFISTFLFFLLDFVGVMGVWGMDMVSGLTRLGIGPYSWSVAGWKAFSVKREGRRLYKFERIGRLLFYSSRTVFEAR